MSCAYHILKAGMAIIGKVKPLKTKAGELYTNETSMAMASFLKIVETIMPNMAFTITNKKTIGKKAKVPGLKGTPKRGCTAEKIKTPTINPIKV